MMLRFRPQTGTKKPLVPWIGHWSRESAAKQQYSVKIQRNVVDMRHNLGQGQTHHNVV